MFERNKAPCFLIQLENTFISFGLVINAVLLTPYTCYALFNDKRVLMQLPFCSLWIICVTEMHFSFCIVRRSLADVSVGRDASIEGESGVGRVKHLATFVYNLRWL
jgi:hypothetical protein